MKYIIDSYAWIEYLDGTKEGEEVKRYLTEENEIYTLDLHIAEVMSKLKRNEKDSETGFKAITSHAKIIPINVEIAKQSGLLHADIRKRIKSFGLIDAFCLVVSRKINARVITGDRHFKNFKEAILIR